MSDDILTKANNAAEEYYNKYLQDNPVIINARTKYLKEDFISGFLISLEEIEKWKKKAEKRTELLENLDESFNKLRDALIKSKSMYWKCYNDYCDWVDEVLKC